MMDFEMEYTELVKVIEATNMAGKNSKPLILSKLKILKAVYDRDLFEKALKGITTKVTK